MDKCAVLVLTRGYRDNADYAQLIRRNISIERNLTDKRIPIVIFHEGNITPDQQQYIADNTKTLTFDFVSIQGFAFIRERVPKYVYAPTRHFSINYRHMCHFWFVDFWHFVADKYDRVIRIDEDCIIDFNIDNLFYKLQSQVAIYGKWQQDAKHVTKNLRNFTNTFQMSSPSGITSGSSHLSSSNIQMSSPSHPSDSNNRKSKMFDDGYVYGPYTNVIGFNIALLNDNPNVKKYVQEVDKTGFIYIFRWGDLPLFGELLTTLFPRDAYSCDLNIRYYHGSHKSSVNLLPVPKVSEYF